MMTVKVRFIHMSMSLGSAGVTEITRKAVKPSTEEQIRPRTRPPALLIGGQWKSSGVMYPRTFSAFASV